MRINKEMISNCFPNVRIIDFTHKDGVTAHLLAVDACPEKGFNFGYILYLPKVIRDVAPIFLRCANTAKSRDSLEDGLKYVFESSIYFDYPSDLIARNQNLPILKPLIPRFHTEEQSFYSHDLTSAVYFTKDKLFKNLDIQMINMVKDAKEKLELLGIEVDEKIIIEGFSAAGVCANRFTVLHPELVKLCISGGFNGKLTLPLKEYARKKVIYPVGVSNISYFTNDYLEEFKLVRQFYFMGSIDFNDSLATIQRDGIIYPLYKDICTKQELDLFLDIFGEKPIDRFMKSKEIYGELGVNADFKIYDGYAHTEEPATRDIELELSNILNKQDKKL